ncbi:MAG: 7-carboxy-7-deazaguanine synthase QueE [Armatimonadetes bacterium]|nr:7-carboxy-7-deazaguanine synthase QueE [Armatimonadota bacterium]
MALFTLLTAESVPPMSPSERLELRNRRKSQAHIVEVFSSFQGEGPHVGERHIFLRFFACNLRCRYCDTPESLTGRPPARLQKLSGEFDVQDNPLMLDEVEAAVRRLAGRPHDALSLTGGEPLLQNDFLRELLPEMQKLGLQMYLETNGTLPERLASIIDLVDIVAMDIKLPETLADGRDWFGEHAAFLEIASQKEVFAKLVLPPEPDLAEVRRAAQMIAGVSKERIPLILQPVTPFGRMTQAPSASDISASYEAARAVLRDVRVIGQTHKLIGLK